MIGLLLTDDERRRFSEWCELSAMSDDEIAKQLDSNFPPLAKIKRTEAAACKIVAKMLKYLEQQTIIP